MFGTLETTTQAILPCGRRCQGTRRTASEPRGRLDISDSRSSKSVEKSDWSSSSISTVGRRSVELNANGPNAVIQPASRPPSPPPSTGATPSAAPSSLTTVLSNKPRTPTTRSSIIEILRSSPLNILLLFIPIGWALYLTHQSGIAVFMVTFISIIPLAQLIGYGTEELEHRVGPTIGGLLNATLGNAVELIVAIIALTQCKLTIVQSSLMGSILSNLLLVLGMCFFCGGTQYADQAFKQMQSQLHSTLLVLSVIAMLVPGAFHFAVQWRNQADSITSDDVSNASQSAAILSISRGVAVILLVIYACYIFFTLYTHASMLEEDDAEFSTEYKNVKALRLPMWLTRKTRPTAGTADLEGGDSVHSVQMEKVDNVEEEEEVAKLTLPVTIGLLVVVTVLVGVTSEFLVDSIDAIVSTGAISEEWVGLILVPIIGNAAEHVSAVTVAIKDKADLAINIAVGSSIQIAVFLIPFMTVLAWAMGKNLTMLFDPFESLSLFLAVLVVSFCVQDGRSNWLEGAVLMCVYVILALCFFFYPGYDPTSFLGITCT